MTRLTLLAIATIAASPAFANIGDIDMQLATIRQEPVVIAEPLSLSQDVAGEDGLCDLPANYLVSIPASFTENDEIAVACLEE